MTYDSSLPLFLITNDIPFFLFWRKEHWPFWSKSLYNFLAWSGLYHETPETLDKCLIDFFSQGQKAWRQKYGNSAEHYKNFLKVNILINKSDTKIFLVFFFKGLLAFLVLYFLSNSDYGLYSFLVVCAMCFNRILDFGTSEGIIADNISDSYRVKIFEIVKIKFVFCFYLWLH